MALLLLLIQIAVVAAWLEKSGQLSPQIVKDTAGYSGFSWNSAGDVFNHQRTPGYPLFLKLNSFVADQHASVPFVQFLVYSSSAIVFFFGVQCLTESSGTACLAASTLMYSRILHGYVETVATEILAAAAGITVCGLTFLYLANRRQQLLLWISLATTAAWLIRPAYLFIVGLVPFLTWQLHSVSLNRFSGSRLRSTGLMLTVTVGPLLAYCLLRYAVIGQFGIVSFGGYNQIGISGQFLNEHDVERLPPKLQPLAEAAFSRQHSDSRITTQYDELPVLNYTRMENRYDLTIWHEFSPAAEQIAGNDPAVVNSMLRQLATELIRLHPKEYFIWTVKAVRQAVKKVLWDFADNPATLFLIMLMVAGLFRPGIAGTKLEASGQLQSWQLLTMSAVSYLVLSLAVVIPVCPPLGRFTDAATVLLAAPLAVAVREIWFPGQYESRRSTDT